MAEEPRRITLKMLANEAGVDVSTVSRALSNDPRVKPETREKIQSLAKRLHYRPNLAARHLVAGRTRTILFLISSFENSYERATCQPAAQILSQAGYDLFTALYGRDPVIQRRLLNRLRQGAADGALLIPGGDEPPESLLEFRQDNRPLILIDRNVPGSGAPLVTTDNAAAATELVRLCYKAGCRDFYVDINVCNSVSRARQEAANAEVRRLKAHLYEGPFTGREEAPRGPWAIIANSQGDALSYLNFFPHHWLEKPLHFGVFDIWAGEPFPAQSVFVAEQDFQRLGEEAAGLMLRMLPEQAEDFSDRIITVPVRKYITLERTFPVG